MTTHRAQIVFIAGGTAVICAAALLALRGQSSHTLVASMATAYETPTPRSGWVLQQVPPGPPTWEPGQPGPDMHFAPATSPPKIVREQAIQIALKELPVDTSKIQVSARYVLMTYDSPELYKGNLEAAGLLDAHPEGWKDLPVWIVSYEGLRRPVGELEPRVLKPGATPRIVPVQREENVIISAENGSYLGAYSFR